jgi:hypothetical protein
MSIERCKVVCGFSVDVRKLEKVQVGHIVKGRACITMEQPGIHEMRKARVFRMIRESNLDFYISRLSCDTDFARVPDGDWVGKDLRGDNANLYANCERRCWFTSTGVHLKKQLLRKV